MKFLLSGLFIGFTFGYVTCCVMVVSKENDDLMYKN